MRLAVLAVFCALTIGCTTPAKTFRPPSDVKLTASTKKVTEGADRAHVVARAAKGHVEEAQKQADSISVLSIKVQRNLDAIMKLAPPELQSMLSTAKGDVATMQTGEEKLHGELGEAYLKQSELERIQVDLDVDIVQWKANQTAYKADAQTLANDATNERSARIVVEKKLIQQRIYSWLWKLGGGALVILIIALIFLWWTGKLAIKLAR